MLSGLLAVASCSSSSGSKADTAPVISNFTMTSPVSAGTTTLNGSLDITDTEGLADVTLNITLSGGGATSTLSQPFTGGSASETAATSTIELILGAAPPAGTYDVTVTATEGGETSNSLSATVTVQ